MIHGVWGRLWAPEHPRLVRVNWYLINVVGRSPFARRALDVRTYAMAMMRRDYGDASKAHMPKHWLPDRPHTRVALDDAIEQSELFCNMPQESRGAGGG